MHFKKMFPFLILSSVASMTLLAGCGTASLEGQKAKSADPFPMASMNQMPVDVQKAPPVVQQAYQFAFANPQVLKQLPCYCGCGGMGHTSNYSCYVKEVSTDGKIEFDAHALGCSICVDITQDTMRMLKAGKSVSEIRVFVDDTYSQYGPSNMPAGQ
jgi:Protein of unknown function with PCYCGC motif